MKLQTAENNWSCTALAFAIALDVDFDEIIKFIGHDGSHITDPEAEEHYGMVGFHFQELIDLVLLRGQTATPYQLRPVSRVNNKIFHAVDTRMEQRVDRFHTLIMAKSGVISGKTNSLHGHTVAFEKGVIYDPRGQTYQFENAKKSLDDHNFMPLEVWTIK